MPRPATALTATVLLTCSLVAGTTTAVAQGPRYPDISRSEELRLALSAGPALVAAGADVYVMGHAGFEKAVSGANGWACIVVRSASNLKQLAPHCLNPQAEQTVLPAFLLEGQLQARGWDAEAINTEMLRQFKSGELPTPSGPAYAWMLSKGQRLTADGGNFKPHFMLYLPYATNASVGADPRQQQFGFVGPYENHPLATMVILMPEFVDPATVKLPPR